MERMNRLRNGWTLLLALSAMALVPGLANAAKLEDLAGDWKLALKMGGALRPADLNIKKKEGESGLTGTVKSQMGIVKIDEIKLDGETYLLHYTMNQGQRVTDVNVALTLKGDELQGQVKLGEGAATIDVQGARAGTESEMILKLAMEAPATGAGKSGAGGLPFAEVGDFAGEWSMTVESQQSGTQVVDFIVSDDKGKAVARLKMPPPIGDQTMTNLTKTEKGLDLRFEMNFGSQTFKIVMALTLKDQKITGTLQDENGLFEIPVNAVRKGQEATAAASSGGSSSTDAAISGRASRARGGLGANVATFTVAGKKFTIAHGRASSEDAGYSGIPNSQAEGFIWSIGKNAATKLQTSADIMVGSTRIPAGRYGLWARKTKQGWTLLVNAKPDVWSTQHDPAADLAEIPMTQSKPDQPVDKLTLEVVEDSGGAALRITWGLTELKAGFKLTNN